MRKVTPAKLEEGRVRSGRWGTDARYGLTGAFQIWGPCGASLRIIANTASAGSAMWEHVSVSTERRPPNWREMCFVKDLFWSEEECVVQFHPPRSAYVNNHPHTLHLWRKEGEAFPTPPSLLVGVKEAGELKDAAEAEALMNQIGGWGL